MNELLYRTNALFLLPFLYLYNFASEFNNHDNKTKSIKT